MDSANVRKALISGDNTTVQSWVRKYPDRFLASYNPDLSLTTSKHEVAAKEFERETDNGVWHAFGEVLLPYAGKPLNLDFSA